MDEVHGSWCVPVVLILCHTPTQFRDCSHPGIFCLCHGVSPHLRVGYTGNRFLNGISWPGAEVVGKFSLLLLPSARSHRVLGARLCMEVVSAPKSAPRNSEVDRDLQLPPHLYASLVPYCSGAPEVQHPGLSTAAGAVRISGIGPPFLCSCDLSRRFQKAIKKVRAVQRMRRNRGFAFSQTENGTKQDQARLIRAYDTSKSAARPSGY